MNRSNQRILIVLAISFIFTGCFIDEDRSSVTSSSTVKIEVDQLKFQTIVIDGCEYLILERDRNNPHEGFGFMAHKGNCGNLVHQYSHPDSTRNN